MSKLITIAAILIMLITCGQPAAADYPNRPLRLIVPFGSGSGPDISARNLANQLGAQLGQQVVVDNRPGATAIIGYEMLARAVPDGYTLGYTALPFATNPSMFSKLPYDSPGDFQPIILFVSSQSLLAVTPSLPIRSLQELIELARAKPGTLSFGSAGNGSSQFLFVALINFKWVARHED